MGGNVTAKNWSTGEETRAVKIPVKEIGRKEFIKTFVEIFKKMNKDFKATYKRPIWVKEEILTNGFAFNGSTSFIMDPTLSDEDVMQYKPSAGDLDITVPEEIGPDLWEFLNKLEGKEILPGARYMGSNRGNKDAIGDQINSVIMVDFKNGQRAYAQVDFELLPFENDVPTEWAKFSHSSSFADAKQGVKAVHHKFLIQAIVGGASARDDIVIVTPKSTPEKLTFKKMNGQLPRMLKFSVTRGIRVAYEPLMDPETNKVLEVDGKQVYKEIPTKDSTYETIVGEIYKLVFRQLVGNEADTKKFESFVGVIELMKQFMDKKSIQRTHDRYIQMLWGYKGQRAQELEVGNPDLDFQVKSSGYSKFVKELKIKDESSKFVDEYYSNYKSVNETFRDYLESL
jgi:hypothetical protein